MRFISVSEIQRNVIKGALASFLIFTLGCQSYLQKSSELKSLIYSGQFTEAEKKLTVLAEKSSDDQLIYMLDLASVLQLSGNYKESNKWLLKADRFSDVQDYTSLSRETGALLLAEELKQYKGEDFEVVLINTMAAINFLAQDQSNEALVEVRRMNEKIKRYRDESDRRYFRNNAFAFYIAGLLWEADGKWDDAFLSYKEAHINLPESDLINRGLLTAAKRSKRNSEYETYRYALPKTFEYPDFAKRGEGELVVIFLQGFGPSKQAHPQNFRYPIMRPNESLVKSASVEIPGFDSVETEKLFSIQDVAVSSLQDQYDKLTAKKVGGIFAKAVVADQFRQKNQALGDLAWVVMNVTDRADLRQWSLLPESLQIARIALPKGGYTVNIKGRDSSSRPLDYNSGDKRVVIKQGEKTFLVWRSFQ